ncbi:MAG: oligosaccharide flippase family protein, partial [Ignavibacteria bacterium]|nr:oligosaccharide flippase family protein [Ignavibacteria bacterium]
MEEKNFKSYFKQGKYIFLYNIFERLTFFAFYISIARYVDKEIYGILVSVSAFTNIIASIFDFGFPFYIQRESASGRFNIYSLFQVVIFKLSLIFILTPISLIYFINDSNYLVPILLISVINLYHPINQIFIFYLNGKEKFKENFYSILFTRIPLFILLVIYTINKVRLEISLITIFLILIIQSFLLLRTVEIKMKDVIEAIYEFKFQSLISILKNSLPFGLGVLFVMAYDRIDVLILKYYYGNVDVAIYSVAYSLFRHTSIFSTAILFQSYNRFTNLFEQKGGINFNSIKNELKLLFTISFSLILIFNFFGDLIINLFFSKNFLVSKTYLSIISIAIPFVYLNNLTGVLLNSLRMERITMLTTFLGLIVNVVLN